MSDNQLPPHPAGRTLIVVPSFTRVSPCFLKHPKLYWILQGVLARNSSTNTPLLSTNLDAPVQALLWIAATPEKYQVYSQYLRSLGVQVIHRLQAESMLQLWLTRLLTSESEREMIKDTTLLIPGITPTLPNNSSSAIPGLTVVAGVDDLQRGAKDKLGCIPLSGARALAIPNFPPDTKRIIVLEKKFDPKCLKHFSKVAKTGTKVEFFSGEQFEFELAILNGTLALSEKPSSYSPEEWAAASATLPQPPQPSPEPTGQPKPEANTASKEPLRGRLAIVWQTIQAQGNNTASICEALKVAGYDSCERRHVYQLRLDLRKLGYQLPPVSDKYARRAHGSAIIPHAQEFSPQDAPTVELAIARLQTAIKNDLERQQQLNREMQGIDARVKANLAKLNPLLAALKLAQEIVGP